MMKLYTTITLLIHALIKGVMLLNNNTNLIKISRKITTVLILLPKRKTTTNYL